MRLALPLLALPAYVACFARPGSFVVHPRAHRRAPPLRNVFNATKSLFEGAVRQVTGDDGYEFGDWTRGAIDETKEGFEQTVRAVTGDDDYEFGDWTRGAIEETKDGFEQTVRAVTGDENYEFGDITRKALSDAEGALGDARDSYFNELPGAVWQRVMIGLSAEQKRDVIVALCQLSACALLCFSLMNNLSVGMLAAISWAISARRSGLSPLADGQWAPYITTLGSLRFVAEPPLLPLRVLLALWLTPSYRALTLKLQRKLPLRKSRPLLNRCLALAVAWLVGNCLAVAAASVGLGALLTALATLGRGAA